jgi:cobalt-zinc-cadmium efflux system membrane fusion protein
MRQFLVTTLLFAALAPAAAELVRISPAQRAALGIDTAPLVASGDLHSARFPAKVAVPNAQLQVVTAPQGGVVEVLLVAEGEEIRAGQPLVRIQSPRLLELQGEYLETGARFRLAESNYERDRQLRKDGIIAERRLRESRAVYQELSASRSRLRHLLQLSGMDDEALRELESQRKLSSSLSVRAPFDGVVLEQLVTAGRGVELADPLYRIARLTPLWLEIHVPLAQLGGLAAGQTVRIPELDLSGQVISVGRMVHGADQGVLVRALVSEGSERLRPGQFVQAQVAAAGGSNSFRVPGAAVLRSGGQSYVFVAREDGFVPVPVTVTSEEPGYQVIQADLQAGTAIAVSGTVALKAAWSAEGE